MTISEETEGDFLGIAALTQAAFGGRLYRLSSGSNPLRGCNTDLAQDSQNFAKPNPLFEHEHEHEHERRTPNAERQTPNAKRDAPNANLGRG
jgi:hypothetical protein